MGLPLCTNLDQFMQKKDWKATKKATDLIISAFKRCIGLDFHYTDEEVWSALFAHQCNAFRMDDGYGLCIVASMFNHSCSPNICRVCDGRHFTFISLRHIDEGEPV